MRIFVIMILTILLSYSILWSDDTQLIDLKAVGGDGVVYLSWAKPKESVRGYWIYKALPGGNYQRLNSNPLEKTFYKDTDVINGEFYWYIVTAVDNEGNESTSSEDAGAMPNIHEKPLSGY